MKKIFIILFVLISLASCRAIQPILVLHPSDLIWIPFAYLILCFFFAKIISNDNNKFWLYFALNLVLTPVLGLIIIVYRLTQNSNE